MGSGIVLGSIALYRPAYLCVLLVCVSVTYVVPVSPSYVSSSVVRKSYLFFMGEQRKVKRKRKNEDKLRYAAHCRVYFSVHQPVLVSDITVLLS